MEDTDNGASANGDGEPRRRRRVSASDIAGE
jgi:hypothetical protein